MLVPARHWWRCTLLTAVQGGYQGALMAPTEVLAEQHHAGVTAMLGDLSVPDSSTLMGERPLRVELLTNRVAAGDRRKILADLVTGKVDIIIGTHALIQERSNTPLSGSSSSTSNTVSVSSNGLRCERRVTPSRRRMSGHDRHPDSSHCGDDGLRRSRRVGAR